MKKWLEKDKRVNKKEQKKKRKKGGNHREKTKEGLKGKLIY